MEDYEMFCKRQLDRFQGESVKIKTSPLTHYKNISCINFYGVPVLSPLLTPERKKELQQDREKALEFEIGLHNSKKRILLNRIQEIVENVQMKKLANRDSTNLSDTANVHLDFDSKGLSGFVTQSSSVLPNSTLPSESVAATKALEIKAADTDVASRGHLLERTENVTPFRPKNIYSALSEKRTCPDGAFSQPVTLSPSKETEKKESTEVISADTENRDPYMMSLQNLLKKSKEYIQREPTRRSLRSNSRRSGSESHSDKENDSVKTSDLAKERSKLTGRSCMGLTPDKSTLPKSSTSLQTSSAGKTNTSVVASSSFSKVDIPIRSGTPPVVDSDSEEDFKNALFFEHDSSIFRSFTGSYSKLPSPEPSMSPKMHRRRPRPSSVGQIVITNPVYAYELSPKEKGRAAGLATQEAGGRQTVADSKPKLAPDMIPVCPSNIHAFRRYSLEISDEFMVGRWNQVRPLSAGQQENRRSLVSATVEGELAFHSEELSRSCLVGSTPPELHSGDHPVMRQNQANASSSKQDSLLDKTKSNVPVELNKSYDVENPSPLLISTQQKPQVDASDVSFTDEQVFNGGLEKVKRRLELGANNMQKENITCSMITEIDVQKKQWLHDQNSSFGTKKETQERHANEEILKQKMFAFEELKKQLEEQHAQQLSLLIAEQEREQERLQKEIAEQERRLKGEKTAVAEMGMAVPTSGIDWEWRKVTDIHLLESVFPRVETLHGANSENAGLTNAAATGSVAESPFYLWDPPASGKSITASRAVNRSKMRWSQVYSPEMKRKLNKISALAKGFLTRRLLQTEKLKHLRQTVKDTREFIKNFQTEAPLKRGSVSAQDANLQERVAAQLRAALYDIHDIFFTMEVSEKMSILYHDREVRKEKMLRQLDKAKTPRERVTLSTATQKSLDRKKYMKASEMGMPNKKMIVKQKTPESRVLQPNQGQNAPIQRLLSRQGTPKASVKGAEQNRKKPSESRVSNKVFSGAYAGKIQRKKPNAVTT
ncbi:centriolar coiled-coil protein of 110 kDa isoform X2 [Anolis carolinensis]|uniref:centriolar coiled-coil protein of 110 kDa isoform X2 n=1 Tax=Anolis carolinensis TaxID=28377 RepID=UPI0007DB72DB|nr:PREDICTED: centriolar coiled-coil protein of 110 kDa isoform X2 [Anolis carolinensis]|eukprot:XP_016854390.1 PREDICTED: centriolar coiled-coil protein of 110 kDa isoform X2 [Anolis carolinensis]